ncbi:hypothetical protein SCUCBS95973_009312 [Sporothrix curviconia]|uniref:Uncharacterized protein n=1 Tax=Sporothrix curviconia TaxID=1260050 RepID=A0ABP0CTV6_9PEZI
MTIATAPVQAPPMAAEPILSRTATPTTTTTTAVAQQPTAEPRPTATVDNDTSATAALRGGNLSLGCHCCHGSVSFYKSCC